MKNKYLKNTFSAVFMLILCCLVSLAPAHAGPINQGLEIKPWAIGQYVSYVILNVEGEGELNRYNISIIDKELIGGEEYFWLKVDIYEFQSTQEWVKEVKNVTFQMLVPPVTSEKWNKDPYRYISNGFFPADAVKLKIQIRDREYIEYDPQEVFIHQDILENSLYTMTPEAQGRIDFAKMETEEGLQRVEVPAGAFVCSHIFVKTHLQAPYYDEGFDLWLSKNVPLLGLVKMEFSKTRYWEKWSYKNERAEIKTIKDLLHYLFTKRVPGRREPDTHKILLVDYGPKR